MNLSLVRLFTNNTDNKKLLSSSQRHFNFKAGYFRTLFPVHGKLFFSQQKVPQFWKISVLSRNNSFCQKKKFFKVF